MIKKSVVLSTFLLLSGLLLGQEFQLSGKIRVAGMEDVVKGVNVFLEETQQLEISDNEGIYSFSDLPSGTYHLTFFAEGYTTDYREISIEDNDVEFNLYLEPLVISVAAVEVHAGLGSNYGLGRLHNVDGVGIYAAKKSEVIELEKTVANLATNNARQVYKGIAGLNIWENDGAGLQLSIGARGLDPNRTSNFNTRQNGYDISADALGYPESYYTPPTQALKRIEIVRGAASLQYGTQFGGLLNFVFKTGPKYKPFSITSENTIGSFGFLNSFNSIGGTKGKVNYYAFYQRKQGDGWRPNSEFEQNTAYANLNFNLSQKLTLRFDYTHMNYLAQQAGGLMDFEFEENPRQSKRARNWFQVDWNLIASEIDYRFSDRTRLNSRSFVLLAGRDALGELGPINRPDPMRERDLIKGRYQNFGNETRLIHRYNFQNNYSTFLIGARYYQGYTHNRQGDGSSGSDPDFSFNNEGDLEKSDYEFPSRNISVFAENLFNLNNRWSITPGVRFEYIRTASDGYYKQRIWSGNQVILERRFEDARVNERSFALLGIGAGYKPMPGMEIYANVSQNFRSINFSDLAVVNPNLVIDSLLSDERGFNADLGIRGDLLDGMVRFDASVFYLSYQDRIGTGTIVIPDPISIERSVDFRTNIGDARILGLEAYAEADVWKMFYGKSAAIGLSVFTNLSILDGLYTSGGPSFEGRQVELIPPISFKTGFTASWKNWQVAYQYAYVHQHFSDATNARFVSNATRGIIPSYSVMDLSTSYRWNRFRFQSGINNLTNAAYFTRRATGYPGPGIIPSDGRSFYLTVGVTL